MLFKIEQDTGDIVSGWLVLDRPDAIPKVRVVTPGSTVVLEANVVRPALKTRGLHTTGKAGFRIDTRIVPNIKKVDDLEVRDAESDLLLYRRQRPQHLPRRLFRCQFQMLPHSQLEETFSHHFAMSYPAAERFTFDQLSSIIANPCAQSIHLCGRPLFSRYERALRDNSFITVALLSDPFEELAEKLLFLRFVAGGNGHASLNQYLTGYESLLELASNIDLSDETSLAAAFRGLSGAHRQALSNPFTRTLACDPDELPTARHLGVALTNLARMDLVGLTSHYEDFALGFNELLGKNVLQNHQPAQVSWTPIFGAKLSQIEEVKDLLSIDIELHSRVTEAVESALGKL